MGLCLIDLCEVVAINLPWVPEDIFFLNDTDGSRRNGVNEAQSAEGSLFKP